MTRHLRMLTTGLALALLPFTASPAHADHYDWYGDCGFDTISQDTLTGPDRYTGFVYANVVPYSNGHGNVVNATVTCEIRVNGMTQMSASAWGSGAVVFVSPASFVATDVDFVQLCTTVDVTSDDTPTVSHCGETTTQQWPPQELIDVFDWLFDVVNGQIMAHVDPVVCAAFAGMAPGTEPVTFNAEGDIFLAGELFWDCPPYADGTTPPPPGEFPPPLPPSFDPPVVSGAGYNTGDAGLLHLREGTDAVATCAYAKDPVTGTITVLGSTATAGADATTVRCRLTDTATGSVLYDESVPAGGPLASLRDTVAAHTGPVTVCTAGTGTWADRTVTVGQHCRPGEPLDRLVS